jgi:hypothetical protein
VAENNCGYSSPTATEGGHTTTPGLQRVDVGDGGCRTVWRSDEVAPSVVPKLSLAAGHVYTYTKPARGDGQDAWYLTAIDARTGDTVFKRRARPHRAARRLPAPRARARDRHRRRHRAGHVHARATRRSPRPRAAVHRRPAPLAARGRPHGAARRLHRPHGPPRLPIEPGAPPLI